MIMCRTSVAGGHRLNNLGSGRIEFLRSADQAEASGPAAVVADGGNGW